MNANILSDLLQVLSIGIITGIGIAFGLSVVSYVIASIIKLIHKT
ncbi:hypothetical protein [Robinsoniella sp. RHS]